MRHGVARCLGFLALFALCAAPAYAQTGSIAGKVTASDGSALPGVTVEAKSNVLPTPRVVVTESNGDYRLPALQPGKYTVTFTLSGMQPVTREADVQLGRETPIEIKLDPKAVTETVTVTAESSLVDKTTPALVNGLSADQMKGLPIGQDYRDLIRFLPGVAYTPDATRGPSAGASGQDNVYKFDGVNVTLPLFGTLSAEPASHDVAQVTVVRGGAQATQFDRAGGFLVDSVSRSGTNRFGGQISYQFQNAGMTAKTVNNSVSKYDAMHGWFDLNGGGPVIKDKLFFYASYYRPEINRGNGSNLYGPLPDYDSTRNEGFVKITAQPTHAILINGSYRDSHRLDTSSVFLGNQSPTTGAGNESWLNVGTVDASWVINSLSFATMTWTHFINRTQGRPDNVSPATVSTTPGALLDIARLDTQGLLTVPTLTAGNAAQNAFVQPIINQYGYVQNGVSVGGGTAGVATTFDKDDFFRDGIQFGYNYTWLMSSATHTLHAGYQWYVDSEDLTRRSNGWGSLSVPAGTRNFNGTPIFYQAAFQQQTTGSVPTIHSEYRSQSFEFNDSIGWRNWNFNAGLLMSNDTLYGQGLRNDASTISGFTAAPGNKYKMYEIPFSKMMQPRLGATWAYDGTNTVFVSYAKYNPAASSLPRAASWDRNLGVTINGYFDASGVLFGTDPNASSAGKLFVPDLTPRTINEILYGTARQFKDRWTGRLYGRYRKGSHYWEDTNNTARLAFNPPAGIPQAPYIANLADQLLQLGSTSNAASRQAAYVIADLDGAFTKYTEATVEAEYHGGRVFFRGSYTWSHYYGNFDQDGSSTVNDSNIFIGSSNIGDGAGRQLWDMKTGDLHGDRPNVFKLYGSYVFNWHGSAGAYLIAESGTPWESWNRHVYDPLIGTSTSDTIRYAEPAGSRRTDGHFQLDLNYTQNIPLQHRFNAQIAFDLFNLGNSQTGYNIQQSANNSLFSQPQNYWDPRRLQIAFRLQY
ncbi:MAG TPA: carboxypeptidase regulatory-like domain-containing protein [Vicinamibacterales bacterium]|nr:carboxypeptidase regulatory-like domain-containing protein [Vicinamibacterales bacterium]